MTPTTVRACIAPGFALSSLGVQAFYRATLACTDAIDQILLRIFEKDPSKIH